MIEIAKILKPHGIAGELKVQLFSDNYDAFSEREFAYIKDGRTHKRIAYKVVRIAAPYIYLKIDGIATRNDAETLHGVFLYLKRDDFEQTDDGEYYVCDLIGLEVAGKDGEKLGTLSDVLQHGAADVYVVKGKSGFMFPALKRVIKKVDLEKGIILVDVDALKEVAVYDV